MSGSDVEAVAARRAALVSALAKLDQRRVELLEEEHDLEVTERVLRRLGELHYGEPLMAEHTPFGGAPSSLRKLVERGLSGGRKALQFVRSAVAR